MSKPNKTVSDDSWQSLWDYSRQDLTMASRILNFICQNDYGRIKILKADVKTIRADPALWESWDRTSAAVQFIAERIRMHGPSLHAFLQDRQFDARETANPRFERRSEWIMTTWPDGSE
jgi:hypothetical protein